MDFVTVLSQFVDANKLGGWTRSFVAVLLGYAAAWSGGKLAPFLTPEMQTAIGVFASTIVVGLWSHIAKNVTPPTTPPSA